VRVKESQERVVRIKKPHKDAKVGLRLGTHPVSKQVIITDLYTGYPALESGRLFVGDVVLMVDGVRLTEVDMGLQLIKMSKEVVELRTTNVYVDSVKPSTPRQQPPPPPPPPPPPREPEPPPPTLDIFGDSLHQAAAPPAPPPPPPTYSAPPPAAVPNLLDVDAPPAQSSAPNLLDGDLGGDLVLGDDDFLKAMEAPGPPQGTQALMPTPTVAGAQPSGIAGMQDLLAQLPSTPIAPPNQPGQAATVPAASRSSDDPWASNLINF